MSDSKHTPVPWGETIAPLIHAGDQRISIGGETPRVACRVLSEDNFQWAKHCVNAHDDLLERVQVLLAIVEEENAEYWGPAIATTKAVIAKATGGEL